MQTESIKFKSHDGVSTINALLWLPQNPKGIVQLVHGMAEHIERYDEFACYLAEQGFAVCGHDHIGHGGSVSSKDDWGHMPMATGAEILIEDVHTLRALMTERLGTELPYVIFGHSMGSFVTRCYLAEHGEGLSGAVLCGTGNLPIALSKAGNTLCHVIGKLRGERYRSKLVDGMAAGGYNKSIKNPRTPVDWLSFETGNVDAYIADERCGFMFTVGGYAAVTEMSAISATAECVAHYPKELPVLLIAGESDPVGDCGKGVLEAAVLIKQAGLEDVSATIYKDMRHEILNEANRQQVMEDVAAWLESKL